MISIARFDLYICWKLTMHPKYTCLYLRNTSIFQAAFHPFPNDEVLINMQVERFVQVWHYYLKLPFLLR